MRTGSLCFSTNQGLGILAKDFYDHGIVTDVMVVRHGRRPENDDWYPNATRITDLNSPRWADIIMEWIKSMDVMLFFETPFLWALLPFCRKHGIKTVLQVQYECMPSTLPEQPDAVLCPSLLDLQYYPSGEFIPVPVPDCIQWKQRTTAKVFVHNAGHGGLKGRNGTLEVMKAMEFVKSPIHLILRSQDKLTGEVFDRFKQDPRVRCFEGTLDASLLYKEGDVFLFPETFNALSLPLQEAYASGMAIMATDRFPMNQWLSGDLLIPTERYINDKVANRCNNFRRAVVSPVTLAETIDRWFNRDIQQYSLAGRKWAQENSWEVLKPRYTTYLNKVLEG